MLIIMYSGLFLIYLSLLATRRSCRSITYSRRLVQALVLMFKGYVNYISNICSFQKLCLYNLHGSRHNQQASNQFQAQFFFLCCMPTLEQSTFSCQGPSHVTRSCINNVQGQTFELIIQLCFEEYK